MTINLVVSGKPLGIDPLEVQGIPRAGDYIRTDKSVTGQYIVLFAAYQVGKEAIDVHVATTSESEEHYALRLKPSVR